MWTNILRGGVRVIESRRGNEKTKGRDGDIPRKPSRDACSNQKRRHNRHEPKVFAPDEQTVRRVL
jgi:hypothetical protein